MSQPNAGAAHLVSNDPLVDLCSELAVLTTREPLFLLLQTTIKKLGLTGDPGLFLLDEEGKHFELFLADKIKKRLPPDDRSWLCSSAHPWPDGFFQLGLGKTEPILLTLDELMRK